MQLAKGMFGAQPLIDKPGGGVKLMIAFYLDRRAALLRVHLSGYYVISMVLLRPGSDPRSDSDGVRGWCGSVHFADSLVCAMAAESRRIR